MRTRPKKRRRGRDESDEKEACREKRSGYRAASPAVSMGRAIMRSPEKQKSAAEIRTGDLFPEGPPFEDENENERDERVRFVERKA